MSDAAIFVAVFAVLFVLRILAATAVFFWILPKGDRCPNCDGVTLHVESRAWKAIMPWLRPSWCYQCGWDGMLRHGALSPPPGKLPANPHVGRHRQPRRPPALADDGDPGNR